MDAIAAGDWDVVIVGGGSAGCVLASRLSEDPGRRVLLVEAGRDVKPGEEGGALLDMYPGRAAFDPANHWPRVAAHFAPVGHNAPERPPARHYEQARLLGGGSSINGQVANRGTPADYDEWAALGASGWDWQGVLPYFRKLERDLDFDGPLHGSDGPIPIHRIARERWPRFSTATGEALEALGFRDICDQNGRFEDGWFPQTISNDGKSRVSASRGYLDASVRARPNLAILAGTQVEALVAEGARIAGIEASKDGRTIRIPARRTIVAAGAVHSPALLLRAGIGPGGDLARLGIPVVADRPGVGRNLQEHPGISVSAFIRPEARLGDTTRRHIHLALRYSSGLPGGMVSDMYLMAAARSAWHPLGTRIGTFVAWINKPHSRGRVVLDEGDPRRPAVAQFEFLADPRDAARLFASVRFMAVLASTPPLAQYLSNVSPSSYTGFAKALGRQTLRNWLITAPAAIALDYVPTLRKAAFARFVAGGIALGDLVADDDTLEAYVRARVFGQWHPCGTCRMGPEADRDAVVDPADARVHGVAGLHVVDASVMPSVPRANLNIPVLMLAEKFAAGLAAVARRD